MARSLAQASGFLPGEQRSFGIQEKPSERATRQGVNMEEGLGRERKRRRANAAFNHNCEKTDDGRRGSGPPSLLLVCWLGKTFYSVYQVGLKPIGLWLSSLKILILSSFSLLAVLKRGKRGPRNTTFGKVSPPFSFLPHSPS